ncbi:flagellar biosynthesis anti-sigma factor FlgM [Denitratisoma oestradiolicum]|uniref:Negative regulator of flagellin synthesis n=1 Tax=Denitratisoma oestradiolicum TaxID=311182 RepID=A0A6S6XX24_9PROT
MKVDNPVSSIGRPSAGPKVSVRSTPTPPRQIPESGSQVQISSLSSQLHGTEALAGGATVVDFKRVAEIKQAIAEGRFKVDPEKIADGLLDSVRQMLHGRSGS